MSGKKHGNNMDAVRYYLAFSVFVAHFSVCTGVNVPWPTPSYVAVGGFFAMSGFLIFRSYNNSPSVLHYLKRRALRILPPYFTVVLLAFIAGIAVTEIGISEYLLSSKAWKYLVSNLIFMNFLEPTLPGVFENNLLPYVNGSLWTMKVEWGLYLSVPVLAWIIRKFQVSTLTTCITTVILAICYRLIFSMLSDATGNEIYDILGRQFIGMMAYFYSGVIFHQLYDSIMRHKLPILIAASALYLIATKSSYLEIVIGPIATSTIVLILCFMGKWGKWFDNKNNFSYDIYLFHFPIIQLWVMFAADSLPSWQLFLLCTLTVLAVSWASLTFVGKHFCLMRK